MGYWQDGVWDNENRGIRRRKERPPSRRCGETGQESGGLLEEVVKGISDAESPSVKDVGVYHRGGHAAVAEELLDRADVVSRLKQMCGEGMTKYMAMGALLDVGEAGGLADGSLQCGLVVVVATQLIGGDVMILPGCREDPLPRPFPTSSWALVGDAGRELDPTRSLGKVAAMSASVFSQ
jgi:hypothetical protein